MSALSKALAVVAFVLATVAGADAAPAVVNTGTAASGSLYNLAVAPVNGNVVVSVITATLTSPGFTDSNSVALTMRENDSGYLWLGDYVVIGSPTSSYSRIGGGGTGAIGGIQISGVNLASSNYCQAASASCSVTTVPGDIVVCLTAGSGAPTLSISNAGAITTVFSSSSSSSGLGYAVATGLSSTCSGTSATLAVAADYTAGGGGGGSASPVTPASGVYPGGYPPYYAFLQ